MRPAQADFFFPCRSVMAKSFQISYLQPSFPWVGYIQILICVAICLLCPYKLQDVMFPRGWCLKLKSRPGRERKMLAALHCLMCHRKTVISTDAIWNTNWPQGACLCLAGVLFYGDVEHRTQQPCRDQGVLFEAKFIMLTVALCRSGTGSPLSECYRALNC